MPSFHALVPAIGLLALCACGESADREVVPPPRDPAITAALLDPILVDPDLTGPDEGGAAITGMDSYTVALPADDRGPEAAMAARAEAIRLAGVQIRKAPEPEVGEPPAKAALTAALTVADTARAVDARCAGRLEYTAAWAARLPPALGVYPRGAVQDAAGTDQAGCRLRAANFRTPISAGDVIDFYYTQARKAGFQVQHRREGVDSVLTGRRSGAAFLVRARAFDREISEVDLVTSGL